MNSRPKKNKDEKRQPLPSKVRPDIKRAVEAIAAEKGGTISNMVESLLAESPRVKRRLKLAAAEV